MSNHFTIKIPCKTYVKAYLEFNCGNLVDLSLMPDLLKEFKICLDKKPEHRESANLTLYCETVTIIIPPDWFYRYGWEMNKENIIDFNKRVEMKVKFFMRQYIAINNSLGTPLITCIREFQTSFGFSEDIWSWDSIRKDFERNGEKCKLKKVKELKEELQNLCLANLSRSGHISNKLKKEYYNG